MSQRFDFDTPVQRLLATLEKQGAERDSQTSEEEPATIHIYPVAGGGVLFSKVPLDQDEPTIIDSGVHETEIPRTKHPPRPGKEPPRILHFLLILCFLVLFDMADSQLTAWLAPTITVALTPKAQTITTTGTFPLGSEGSMNGVAGRILPELTLTQSASTTATGHGHQDAMAASGILTFYNGSFSFQTVDAGMVLTGSGGVPVVTDQTVTIPPNLPPRDGQAHIPAHALHAGQAGNIPPLALNGTVSSALYVKNLAPFTEGQDARDYPTVIGADIQRVVTNLTPDLLQSTQAALLGQLTASEALVPPMCTPHVTTDHGPGSEAAAVHVTVSETCTGVAYNQQVMQEKALQLLTNMAATQLGTSYTLTGAVHVTITQATVTKRLVLSLTCAGTWVYTLTPQEQQRIKQIIAGRTKQQALRLLLSLHGIVHVAISGVPGNQPLPQDLTHIHLILIFGIP